jgi:hypothetical protein
MHWKQYTPQAHACLAVEAAVATTHHGPDRAKSQLLGTHIAHILNAEQQQAQRSSNS